MNTADLITSFFNNEMSPDQERQFLVSVASSDSLRLGMKSHVMLDKILNEQADFTKAPLNVRSTIMREAAIVAAAGSALSASEALANKGTVQHSKVTQPSTVGRTGLHLSRWLSVTMALVLAVGSFFAGFYTGTDTAGTDLQTVVTGGTLPSQKTEVATFSPISTSSALVTGDDLRVVEEPVSVGTLAGASLETVASKDDTRDVAGRQSGNSVVENTSSQDLGTPTTLAREPASGTQITYQLNKKQVSDTTKIPELSKKD